MSTGTTSVVLDAGGTLHSEARHLPYGAERWSSGTLPTEYRFTGQRLDGYTNLYIMGARWYDYYSPQFRAKMIGFECHLHDHNSD